MHVGAKWARLEAIKALVASPACDVDMNDKKRQTALDIARSKPWSDEDNTQVVEYLENIISNPSPGTRINTMEHSCETLKSAKNQMNENQCKRCDELTKRVLDLERQMKQINNDKSKRNKLSEKDKDIIRKLQEEVRKLNEQIQQLTSELRYIKNQHIVSTPASVGTNEYNG